MTTSIMYRHPVLYKLMLLAVHGKHLKERYQFIAHELEGFNSVFEPLCGPALLPKHLQGSIQYSGFDINEGFVHYATQKGHDVVVGDAREDIPFEEKQADAVVLIDALHHIQPYEAQQQLIQRAASVARSKIIVCDPFGDRYFSMIKSFPFLRKPAEWFFNWIEQDGPSESRFEHIQTKESLEARMRDGYGVLGEAKIRVSQSGKEDLIAIYEI